MAPHASLVALEQFVATPISALAEPPGDGASEARALCADVLATVPAYRDFLGPTAPPEFARLPLLTKENYLRRYPLMTRCRGGALAACDMVAVSSGSTGEPTIWPRSLGHETAVATRFEQVLHDSFAAHTRSTLGVICFPLGTWVGGMYTTSACRLVALKGYPLTLVTPGNNVLEILRAVRELAPAFEQTVLFGYPPFLKDVVDAGRAQGIEWSRYAPKLVLAGEVVSEAWRALMAERLGQTDVLRDSAVLYGTADAGVLGCESPISIALRRFYAGRPELATGLFGKERLPTLVQYDPRLRYFEVHEATLVITADGGAPLIRYHIADDGGLFSFDALMERARADGFDARAAVGDAPVRPLPFVYVFGRSRFAVSIYGANVFPETVALALEQPEVAPALTGKFVLEVLSDADQNKRLAVAVELAEGSGATAELAARVTQVVTTQLLAHNSEYRAYVPSARHAPRITLYPARHPEYFPTGVKHRYSR